MRKFEVWTEGYAASGESSGAIFHGSVDADTFDEACIKVFGDDLDKDPLQSDGYRRNRDGRMSIWACGCYDDEGEARVSFG